MDRPRTSLAALGVLALTWVSIAPLQSHAEGVHVIVSSMQDPVATDTSATDTSAVVSPPVGEAPAPPPSALPPSAPPAPPPSAPPAPSAPSIPSLAGVPPWTLRYGLPTALIGMTRSDSGSSCRAVRRLWDRIVAARYPDPVVFAAVPAGFVIVCPPEHIDASNGKRTNQFFTLDATPVSRWRPWEWVSGVFSPHVDRYRILVLAVGVDQSANGLAITSGDSLSALRQRGATSFRQSLCPGGFADPSCVALVYEFMRAGRQDTLSFVPQSRITLSDHLRGTRVWTKEELDALGP